jgi:hypothetical protein
VSAPYDEGAPLAPLARHVGDLGWQLVPTQWHRDRRTGKAGQTPVRGATGRAPFLTSEQMQAKVCDLVLHLECGPDCTGRIAKPGLRPPQYVTLFDVDHYSGNPAATH